MKLAYWIETGLRLMVGGSLLIAGVSKISLPYVFLSDIYLYQVLGATTAVAVATVLPFLEVVVGVALLSGISKRGAMALAIVLLCLFVGAQSLALQKGLTINCGCFSAVGSRVSLGTVMSTSLMLLAAISSYAVSMSIAKHQTRSADKGARTRGFHCLV